MKMRFWAMVLVSTMFTVGVLAEQCGIQAENKLCPDGLCCSEYGYCGSAPIYCEGGCQSQCSPSPPPPSPSPPSPSPPPPSPSPPPSNGAISSLISSDMFERLLLHRNDAGCPAKGFYTYNAFIEAANYFPAFGTTGTTDIRKREIAAFLAQTSHETTGGWPDAPDGPFTWGYCFLVQQGDTSAHCVPNQQWPCVAGKKYYGRGPIQISYNYNYGPAGAALKYDLLSNPDEVATDPTISFKTALWFWMTAQSPKPSCHNVIIGQWTPSSVDKTANRLPGYGVITNIINGGVECGKGIIPEGEDRIGFYKKYCDIFGVSYGDNLDCYTQSPFA